MNPAGALYVGWHGPGRRYLPAGRIPIVTAMFYINRLLLYLTSLVTRRGFCYVCERDTEWVDDVTHYRCTHCGRDPLERGA